MFSEIKSCQRLGVSGKVRSDSRNIVDKGTMQYCIVRGTVWFCEGLRHVLVKTC